MLGVQSVVTKINGDRGALVSGSRACRSRPIGINASNSIRQATSKKIQKSKAKSSVCEIYTSKPVAGERLFNAIDADGIRHSLTWKRVSFIDSSIGQAVIGIGYLFTNIGYFFFSRYIGFFFNRYYRVYF